MRILVLGEGDAETFDAWSGISHSLVTQLRAMGHEVIAGDVDLYGPVRWATILLSWSPNRFRWWAKYHLTRLPFEIRSWRAQRILSKNADRIDVVLQFGATFEPRGRRSIPYAIYCDGNARLIEQGDYTDKAEITALTTRERARQILREKSIYDQSSKIFTFSERLRGSFISDFDQDAEKVCVVYAGANIDPGPMESGFLPIPDRPPTVLFVGRAFERKGGDLLLRAFRHVRSQVPNARLVIVGPDDINFDQPGVEGLGFLRKDDEADATRLRAAYANADVFCLPTRYEPFGVVFIEAMLYGLPCIGPRAWAVPEIVIDGDTGILFPPEDVTALTDALVHLLTDRKRARAMGSRGRTRAERRFSWAEVATRISDGLQQVHLASGRSSQA